MLTEDRTIAQYKTELTTAQQMLLDSRAEVSELQATNLQLSERLGQLRELSETNRRLMQLLAQAQRRAQGRQVWRQYGAAVIVGLILIAIAGLEVWRIG